MGTSLLHLSLPPHSSFQRKEQYVSVDDTKSYRNFRLLRCFTMKSLLKLQCSLKRNCMPSSTLNSEQDQRSKLLDLSNLNMDDMNEFERQLQELFGEVKAMLEMGNRNDAIDLLQANYEVVKEQIDCGFKGIEQAAFMDIIALGYMGTGEFKLVHHLLRMLNEILGGLDDDKPLLDSILMHMGSMYATLGKFDDAVLVYKRGLRILEAEFGNNSPFLITPLMGMAKVYRLIGRATKATTIYRRAIGILEMNRGTESEELVVPLFGLGNLFINEGKSEDAEACFRRILSIYTNVYGENDGRVGMAMCSLAHALCAKGNVEEAIVLYRRGLQVISNSEYVTLDDDLLEKMRTDLAELLHVTGREQEGRELLQECLLITERYKGIEHPSAVAHLVNLATSYSRSKNFAEAERMLRTCLHIMLKTVGSEDQSVTVPMLHLAVVLYNLERDEEAESLALKAVKIREVSFGKESLPVGEALDCLVSIQTRLGKDDSDILAKLKRILSIQENELGYDSEEAVTTLKKVVFFLNKMGKKDEKLPLERRLHLLRTKFKQNVAV